MRSLSISALSVALLSLLLCACSTTHYSVPNEAPIDTSRLPPPDRALSIPGLSPCSETSGSIVKVNSNEPVTVLVHGCFSSAGRYRALAQVFAFHGQQAVCFSYNDRDSLTRSASELTAALNQLSQQMNSQKITVIGHSQGGLIARKALTTDAAVVLEKPDNKISLVTVSAPFSGIYAADHCGSALAQTMSLGLIGSICKAVTGDKWYEITRYSSFIRGPGEFSPQVIDHLKVVTDERNSCRVYGPENQCLEDDYVFSIEEQYQDSVDRARNTRNVQVVAGHAEIVGNHLVAPKKLIAVLQDHDVLLATPRERQVSFEALLACLYR